MKITRKEFFKVSSKAIGIIAIPGLLASILESCNSSSSNPITASSSTLQSIQATPKNNIISLTIDSSSPLSSSGGALLVNSSNANILVDRLDQNSFNALSAICTHQGCLISAYDSGSHQFVCPCHGSRFDLSGKVVNGPASRSLSQFQTQFNNNILTINI